MSPQAELAPVDRGDELTETIDYDHVAPKAPVFPTEADAERIRADVIAKTPELAGASHHKVTRAVQAAIAKEAERLSRVRHRVAHIEELATAPIFPTEAQVNELRATLPNLTPDEETAVLLAGHAAFLATLASGEPVTEAPEEEEPAK